MYLKITDQAQKKLSSYVNENTIVILDMDDGAGEYSKVGFCSLDMSFRILILNSSQSKKDYDALVESSIGDIYIKDYSKRYLDEEMTLDFDQRLHTLNLKTPSGTLDSSVQIVDLRPERTTG
ncbi:iron-sulfur cluster biosynthesis family protein [Enterococcus sp. LJL51]|uniref:iron-sulfur cluster biosynthesis family protein n=1 Tax=Enterococcus sp. LJL51 TaxID=3416656 RepID=UPI003CEF68F9